MQAAAGLLLLCWLAAAQLRARRRRSAGAGAAAGASGAASQRMDAATGAADARQPGPQATQPCIPVTLITGFLGAGKTTVLAALLRGGAGGAGSTGLRLGLVRPRVGVFNELT